MKAFPIMLNLQGRLAVVIGAGAVGLGRVRALLEAQARVTLIDPALSGPAMIDPALADAALADPALIDPALSDPALIDAALPDPASQNTGMSKPADAAPQPGLESVHIVAAPYEPAHLAGAMLVFACTGDRALNERIAADARAQGSLVNVADQADACDFHMPAVVREGDVVVAVGTGGAAAALSAALRDRLARALPPQVGPFAEALADCRSRLRDRLADPSGRMRIARHLAGSQGYQAFVREGPRGLRRLMHKCLGDLHANPLRGP